MLLIIIFHLGLFVLFLHMQTCNFTCYYSGVFSFSHLVTHTPTLQVFYADAHRFTLKCWWLVGGVGVGGTNQPTHRPTHPANYLPTHLHPSTDTHPATMQGFCADVHRLTMEAILRLLLEQSRTRRTADAAA